MTASRSLKSPLSLPNAAISVGHTKVKSLGQKKTIFHLPASDLSVTRVNALSMSVDTTAGTSKAGILSPIVNTVLSLKGWKSYEAQCGAWPPIDPTINIRYTDRMNRSAPSLPSGALPSLRQLRYLVVLAERLNFREAAEACFVTQSTLSAGIKELESQL